MSQSMQAEANVDEEIQKVKEMKTPPKININNYNQSHINDSFEFWKMADYFLSRQNFILHKN